MSEQIFRWILILGFLIIMPMAARFRLKAHLGGEKLDRLQEGWPILLGIRIFALASAFGVIAFAINPASMAGTQLALPEWVRWLGLPIGIAGGSLFLWTMSNLGKNLTDTVIVRKDATLVTSGPYRFVRHPFYGAMFLMFLANSLLTANWFLAFTGGFVLFFIYQRTAIEEQKLTDRFGDQYRQYMKTTPRFIPSVGK